MSTPWPTAADYVNMLQNPQLAFRDPEFQQCEIELENGLPRPRSGTFATVYKATLRSGRNWAIRVFTKRSPERRTRYEKIYNYLKGQSLKSIVGFNYDDEGIKVIVKGRPARFPLLKMEWVSGQTLQHFTRQCCEGTNGKLLERSADRWIELIRELTSANIAHGDLQHGNVMVDAAGELKLVDYDCMCVPGLEGEPSLEAGLPPYQHHARKGDSTLFPGMDHFSALFILVSLKALAAAPTLWSRFVEPPPGSNRPIRDSLLFEASDFLQPQQSELMQELRRSPDRKVQKWTEDLLGCWKKQRLEDIPPLDEFATDYEQLRLLLKSYDYDAAVQLAGQQPLPGDLQRDVQQARERVNKRIELQGAVQRGDEASMQQMADSPLLSDYPKAQADLAIAKDAARVLPILKELEQALQQQHGRIFVQVWDRHATLLNTRTSAAVFKSPLDSWRNRNRLCDEIRAMLALPSCDPPQLDQFGRMHSVLDRLGGHPELQSQRGPIEQYLIRGTAFRAWKSVPMQISADNDAQRVVQWNEPVFQGWPPAEKERPEFTSAQRRLDSWNRLKQLLPQPDRCLSASAENEIVQQGASLPAGYDPRFTTRVKVARERLEALSQVQTAIQQSREEALAAAYRAIDTLQARPMLNATQQDRLEISLRRLPLLKALTSIPLDSQIITPEGARRRDQQLLDLWDDGLLQDCQDARPWRGFWQQAGLRRPLLVQLDEAIEAGDVPTVVSLMEMAPLKDFPLSTENRGKIAAAQQDFEHVRELTEAIQRSDPLAFRAAYQTSIVLQHPTQFTPIHNGLTALLEREILPLDKNGLSRIGLQELPTHSPTMLKVKLQWNWPLPDLTDRCVVAVTRRKVTVPDQIPPKELITVTRRDYDGMGCRIIPLPATMRGATVVVWMLVDVGFARWWSPPVVLGRIPPASGPVRRT